MPGPDLSRLEATLGHTFSDRRLLQHALTHSSLANEAADGRRDNEQLEFLGDSVLGLATSRVLFDRFPSYTEGHLSKMRAHLVSARHLIKVAKEMGLGEHLLLGRGEERSGGRAKAALLVDALEAAIGALYLDAGLEVASRFIVSTILSPELDRLQRDPEKVLELSDQKSALQERLQATGRPQPSYHVVQEEGPDHKKVFTVEIRFTPDGAAEELVARGAGTTKKKAEQRAAQNALAALKQAQVTIERDR